MRIYFIGFAVATAVLLSGCGSKYEMEPVGIGTDPSELKRSPCACLEMKFDRALPDWFLDGLAG